MQIISPNWTFLQPTSMLHHVAQEFVIQDMGAVIMRVADEPLTISS